MQTDTTDCIAYPANAIDWLLRVGSACDLNVATQSGRYDLWLRAEPTSPPQKSCRSRSTTGESGRTSSLLTTATTSSCTSWPSTLFQKTQTAAAAAAARCHRAGGHGAPRSRDRDVTRTCRRSSAELSSGSRRDNLRPHSDTSASTIASRAHTLLPQFAIGLRK